MSRENSWEQHEQWCWQSRRNGTALHLQPSHQPSPELQSWDGHPELSWIIKTIMSIRAMGSGTAPHSPVTGWELPLERGINLGERDPSVNCQHCQRNECLQSWRGVWVAHHNIHWLHLLFWVKDGHRFLSTLSIQKWHCFPFSQIWLALGFLLVKNVAEVTLCSFWSWDLEDRALPLIFTIHGLGGHPSELHLS